MTRRGRVALIAVAGLAVAGAAAAVVLTGPASHGPVAGAAPRTTVSATPSASAVPAPPSIDAAAVAALPEVQYSAVIGGLLGYGQTVPTDVTPTVYSIDADAPLYGADRTTAVARFGAKDFLGAASIIVGVERQGPWELVLTPARQVLPSTVAAGNTAPAQTAAWVPRSLLHETATPTSRVVISTSAQTVSIVDASGATTASFPAGVGTTDTPTPTNVTGYLEQRYVDPAQGTGDEAIQLTSLHSAAADEPYGGSDGGLIGVHYYDVHAGAVSHGCIRLDRTAVEAVNALPLGTLVTVE
jgi:hypothetical protein